MHQISLFTDHFTRITPPSCRVSVWVIGPGIFKTPGMSSVCTSLYLHFLIYKHRRYHTTTSADLWNIYSSYKDHYVAPYIAWDRNKTASKILRQLTLVLWCQYKIHSCIETYTFIHVIISHVEPVCSEVFDITSEVQRTGRCSLWWLGPSACPWHPAARGLSRPVPPPPALLFASQQHPPCHIYCRLSHDLSDDQQMSSPQPRNRVASRACVCVF